MTPTQIKAALSSLGGGANKQLGQHFLIDQEVLETIVGEAHVHPAQVTLEIGPGLGVLTRALLDKGLEVVAIEKDRRFVQYLADAFDPRRGVIHHALRPAGRPVGSIGPFAAARGDANQGVMNHAPTVIAGDAADLDWMSVVGDAEWQLISNLPYAISSLALRKALWSTRPAENVVVLVQREVGERAIAVATETGEKVKGEKQKRKTSLLSLMVALASSDARIVRHVPPGAFYPPPKVDSVVLQITPMPWPERKEKWGIDPEKIMEVAKAGFAHPRKLLASNLKSVFDSVGAHGMRPDRSEPGDRASSMTPLRETGIPEKARAEDLSPEMWARLARYVFKK